MLRTSPLQQLPDFSPEQKESAEIAKMIRKLRWIGKEDEAHSLEIQMTEYRLVARASVLADPLSTD